MIRPRPRRSLAVALPALVGVLALGVRAAAPAGAQERHPSERGRDSAASRASSVKPGPLPGGGHVSARSPGSPKLVSFIQRRIAASGLRLRVDGVFGSETDAAVRRYQAARRLLVDGIVGRQTMSALRALATRPTSAGERSLGAAQGGQSRLESRRAGGRRGRGRLGRRDRDHDRLPDRWERRYGLSTKKKSAREDRDRDGLDSLAEFRSRTRPRDADSDKDRIGDADEDPDRDRVDNGSEVRARTHPRRRDSDRDGRPDGREDRDRDWLANAAEDRSGNDPADSDSDDDGVRDGDEIAGTVRSFQNGVLTIERFNGGPLSARLTEDTGLDCVGEDDSDASEPPGDEADGDDEADEGREEDDVAADSHDDDAASPDDDGEDPCMRALVLGAGIRSAELDDGADAPEWSDVEVVR